MTTRKDFPLDEFNQRFLLVIKELLADYDNLLEAYNEYREKEGYDGSDEDESAIDARNILKEYNVS